MRVLPGAICKPLENPKMRKLVVLAALAACMAVGACNTVSGAGRDVSSAGKAVTETANDAKN